MHNCTVEMVQDDSEGTLVESLREMSLVQPAGSVEPSAVESPMAAV